MKKWIVCVLFFTSSICVPALASEDVRMLKSELEKMSQAMEMLQQKIETLEKATQEEKEEVEYLSGRMDKAELHTVTDRLSLGVEIRTDAHSIHYDDMLSAPAAFKAAMLGQSGNTRPVIMGNLGSALPAFPPEKYDAENNFIPTTKFNLNMQGKVNNQLRFDGRLAAYKAWGDSSGVKVNGGSLGDVTMDGNTASIPHGDTIHLDRAYFVYSTQTSSVPISFSLGRRPSTDGPPMEYGKNSLEAGSPLASIINWQFDGASLSFNLEEVTGISGSAIKFCYGLGFEGDWGNSYALQNSSSAVDDVHMAGIIASIYDDESFSATLNYAHAWDITDGFTGLTVMPIIVTENANGTYSFAQNTGGYISRMEPASDIGNWDAASLLLRSNLNEYIEKDIDLFLALSWSHTDPTQVSKNPYYKLIGQGLLSSNDQLESRHGYSIYAGARLPLPMGGKLGLEYNWGSKYWFNFTGAEDSLTGSKLAARGSVYEAYWLQPIISNNFFLKLGGKYFDYEYTGSGNPLGEPVKISSASSLDAFFPIIDTAWDLYASLTMRF